MSNYTGKFNINDLNSSWNKCFDLVKNNSIVLDVGSSSGNFGEALVEHKSCIVDGIEPDQEDAGLAKTKLRRVYNGILEDAYSGNFFEGYKYDYITFIDVIEHIYDPVEELKELKKLLKPNGQIIFSIPNMAHASVRIMLLGGDFEYGKTGLLDYTHLRFFTKKEIHRVFSEAGFVIEKWDYTDAVYNREILIKELKKIGVSKPSNDLIKLLSKEDAKVFQYIGSAKANNLVNHKRKTYSPDPQRPIKGWYDEQVKYLSQLSTASEEKIAELNKEIEVANNKLREAVNRLNEASTIKRSIKHYLRRKAKQ